MLFERFYGLRARLYVVVCKFTSFARAICAFLSVELAQMTFVPNIGFQPQRTFVASVC